jgi:AcrR family transcriptional regulator
MGRPAHFTDEQIIGAASRIAARIGPTQTTIALIAKEAKAPVGSVYHRYSSRGALLAEAWIAAAERFGAQFRGIIDTAVTLDEALEAALATPHFARQDHAGGVLLFAYRRDDFLDEAPNESRDRAIKQTSDVLHSIAEAAKRLMPKDARAREKLAIALIGLPYGAVRIFLPHAVPPKELDGTILAAARAAIQH